MLTSFWNYCIYQTYMLHQEIKRNKIIVDTRLIGNPIIVAFLFVVYKNRVCEKTLKVAL